ncbi:MAG: hypothetical protein JSV12_08160, partial [Candidatus Bathyarchaeota archaeon]
MSINRARKVIDRKTTISVTLTCNIGVTCLVFSLDSIKDSYIRYKSWFDRWNKRWDMLRSFVLKASL